MHPSLGIAPRHCWCQKDSKATKGMGGGTPWGSGQRSEGPGLGYGKHTPTRTKQPATENTMGAETAEKLTTKINGKCKPTNCKESCEIIVVQYSLKCMGGGGVDTVSVHRLIPVLVTWLQGWPSLLFGFTESPKSRGQKTSLSGNANGTLPKRDGFHKMVARWLSHLVKTIL